MDNCNQELIVESFSELIDLIKNWKLSNEKSSRKEFYSTQVTDEEFEKLKKDIEILHNEDDYSIYQKAFNRFCYYCHIVPRGTIIIKHKLEKGKEPNKNKLYVQYTENTKRIQIPQDTDLYHISKIGNIKELKPFFRGKSERGFLYDKPRIYFSLHKKMPRLMADYTHPNQKLYRYKLKNTNLKNVFIDPMLKNSYYAAVYIETNKPLSVENLSNPNNINESTLYSKYLEFFIENNISINENLLNELKNKINDNL